MPAAAFTHPSIGEIQANSKEGVLQFLGIQYATLKDRFAQPVLKEYSQDGKLDATKNGPQVLAIPNGADFEAGLVQHDIPYDRSTVTMSDIEGLNLNITVPTSSEGKVLGDGKKLPVFAFIHGGGFNGGSASFVQYDMARFVKISVARGMPVIAVSLNYRLGAPGFLYSEDMKAAGYKPNNGLRDQRTALIWLQKYLPGFGGDSENVTLMGESAGGVSVAYHLHSKEPLFKRAMMMSGTTLLMQPAPIQAAEANYAKTLKVLGLEDLKPEERVKQLREMDGQELRGKLMQGGVPGFPVIDGDIAPTHVTFEGVSSGKLDLPGRKWCEGLLNGDCQFDGSINALRIGHRKSNIASAFTSTITSTLPEIASDFLSAYNLSPSTPDSEAFDKILIAGTDIQWYLPTLTFAQGLQNDMSVYVYRFNEGLPWPGPNQGRAAHITDLVFLLQNYNDYFDEGQRELAEGFAGDVVAFCNGREPWEGWKGERKRAKVLVVGGEKVVEDVPELTGRSAEILRLGGMVGFDKLSDTYNAFLRG